MITCQPTLAAEVSAYHDWSMACLKRDCAKMSSSPTKQCIDAIALCYSPKPAVTWRCVNDDGTPWVRPTPQPGPRP